MTKSVIEAAGTPPMGELAAALAGRTVLPDADEYETLRTPIYGGIDKRPGAIVRARTAEDVVQAVGFARRHGLELAIRSGGHSLAGHCCSEGGLVIDLRDMNSIEIDPASRTAWAGAGATASAFTAAAERYGLAVGFGDAGSVGLGGITSGGGVGYLSRKYGLTIDSLMAAEVVTADGRIIETSEAQHPDLFWAIRGGGGNFGVLTRLKFQLHPLPEFTGGMLVLPATAETIAGFIAACEAAPEELSAICNVMSAPPMPFLAPEHHGKLIIMGMVAFAGPQAAAERALAPIRALATPLADMVRTGPYLSMYPPEDHSYRPTAVVRTMLLDSVDMADAEVILRHLTLSDAPMRVTQLRVLGGAVARVALDATAYAHRQSRIMANLAAFYTGPDDKPRKQAWLAAFAAELNPGGTAAYVNFLGDEGPDRIRAAYPGATWDRLTRIKRQYDPENLFRLNQNIPPPG